MALVSVGMLDSIQGRVMSGVHMPDWSPSLALVLQKDDLKPNIAVTPNVHDPA
jgi:hypothetical protein